MILYNSLELSVPVKVCYINMTVEVPGFQVLMKNRKGKKKSRSGGNAVLINFLKMIFVSMFQF